MKPVDIVMLIITAGIGFAVYGLTTRRAMATPQQQWLSRPMEQNQVGYNSANGYPSSLAAAVSGPVRATEGIAPSQGMVYPDYITDPNGIGF